MIKHSPEFIKDLVDRLDAKGIPVVTPAGGLGAHLDALGFLPHVPQLQYPAGALGAALFIVSGVRGMVSRRWALSLKSLPKRSSEYSSSS